eukprot:Nk52_evm16s317 gene=Nk52_evmTU16s317
MAAVPPRLSSFCVAVLIFLCCLSEGSQSRHQPRGGYDSPLNHIGAPFSTGGVIPANYTNVIDVYYITSGDCCSVWNSRYLPEDQTLLLSVRPRFTQEKGLQIRSIGEASAVIGNYYPNEVMLEVENGDMSSTILNFRVPERFLKEVIEYKEKVPVHPSEDIPPLFEIIVTEMKLTLIDCRSIGSFLSNNIAKADSLMLIVENEMEKTTINEDVFKGLDKLKSLYFTFKRHESLVDNTLEVLPDILLHLPNKLTMLHIDIPFANLASWDLSRFKSLNALKIRAGIPPIPKPDPRGLFYPMRTLTEHGSISIEAMMCSREESGYSSSTYFNSFCKGNSAIMGSSRLTQLSLRAPPCAIPQRLPSACWSSLLKDYSSIRLHGFVIDDAAIDNLSSSKAVGLVDVVWNVSLCMDVAKVDTLDMKLRDAVPGTYHSPIEIDVAGLCSSSKGCIRLSIDGGRNTPQPLVKSSGCSDYNRSTNYYTQSTTLRHVNVSESAWREVTPPLGVGVTELKLEHVDNANLDLVFPCSVGISSCNISAPRSLKKFALEAILESNAADWELGSSIFSDMPALNAFEVTNKPLRFAKASLFESLYVISLINSSLSDVHLPPRDVARAYSLNISSNNLTNVNHYMNNSHLVQFDGSKNQISQLNVTGMEAPPCTAIKDQFFCTYGLIGLDMSHNRIPMVDMELYRIMSMFLDISMTLWKSINFSHNNITDISFYNEFAPTGSVSRRNMTTAYAKKRYVDGSKPSVYSSLDLSYNFIKHLPKSSIHAWPSLKAINLSNSRIENIHPEFISGGTCSWYRCHVDLSHNDLGRSSVEFTSQSALPSSVLDFSHNNLEQIPVGLKYILHNVERNTLSNSSIIEVSIILSYNKIRRVDFPICGATTKSRRSWETLQKFVYVDLSHNVITEIAESAFDCGNWFVLLNLNHNPIRKLPELTQKHRLYLLSAGDTQISNIPESYRSAKLFYLKSFFVSGPNMIWQCCRIQEIFTATNILTVDLDTYQETGGGRINIEQLIFSLGKESIHKSNHNVSLLFQLCMPPSYGNNAPLMPFESFMNSSISCPKSSVASQFNIATFVLIVVPMGILYIFLVIVYAVLHLMLDDPAAVISPSISWEQYRDGVGSSEAPYVMSGTAANGEEAGYVVFSRSSEYPDEAPTEYPGITSSEHPDVASSEYLAIASSRQSYYLAGVPQLG